MAIESALSGQPAVIAAWRGIAQVMGDSVIAVVAGRHVYLSFVLNLSHIFNEQLIDTYRNDYS